MSGNAHSKYSTQCYNPETYYATTTKDDCSYSQKSCATTRTRSSSESTTEGSEYGSSSEYAPSFYPSHVAKTMDGQYKPVVPSTPFLHKYKTEMCKNWELTGACKFGENVS